MKSDLVFGHPAWIEIDLKQFKKNLDIVKKHSGKAKLCLPVKANAYGHGLVAIAQTAVAWGVDYLGVSCLQEGALLRQAGITIPIIVFGAIHQEQIPELLANDLELTIASGYKAELVANYCKQVNKQCKVHLEIDTGMCRTGVRPETGMSVLDYLNEEPCFEVVGIYSHFATADNPKDAFALEQMRAFQHIIEHAKKSNPSIIAHMANSGALCYYQNSPMDMVRPGLLAYGYFPSGVESGYEGIAPILSLKSTIAYSKIVPKNRGISYGLTYTTPADSRIVTVPVGYGDGYRRALSNKAKVLIRGKAYPIVGNICMDQFMVNAGNDEAFVGDEVVLVGQQGNEKIFLEDVAKFCDTIIYEILCGFNSRLPRVYKE